VIVAERDREPPQQSKAAISAMKSRFKAIYVEIGSGSGMHIIQLAQNNPDTLCIGLEIRFKRAFKTGEKAEKLGLNNVLVLRTDARCLNDLFSQGEVDAFYINYPDPWDKRRWKKNRLLNQDMLATLHTLLRPEGHLRYKTDHQEYFASTLELLGAGQWQRLKLTTDLVNSEWSEATIPTEFEYLFKSQDKPLCFLEARKV
jgi:tRNA (guanine-N7-)-methyltransferase